jgi:hypothetical protein
MTGRAPMTRETLLGLAAAVGLTIPEEDVDAVLTTVQGQLDRVAIWTDTGLDGPDPDVVFDPRWP